MSNKRFMQGLEIKIDKVLKFKQWCTQLKNKKSQLSGYNVTSVSHWSGNLQYQYLNDQVAGLLKSGNKKADWLSYY